MPSSRCRINRFFICLRVSARFLHGFKTCKGCKSLQNRTKGAEIPISKFAMYRREIALKRNFQKLRESPGVRYESVARGFQRVGMSTVEAVNRKISWLFCFSGRVCTLLHISCTLYKKAMLPYAIFYPSFFFFFNSFPEILTHKDGFRGSLFFGKNDLHSSVECGWEPWVRRLRTK